MIKVKRERKINLVARICPLEDRTPGVPLVFFA